MGKQPFATAHRLRRLTTRHSGGARAEPARFARQTLQSAVRPVRFTHKFWERKEQQKTLPTNPFEASATTSYLVTGEKWDGCVVMTGRMIFIPIPVRPQHSREP